MPLITDRMSEKKPDSGGGSIKRSTTRSQATRLAQTTPSKSGGNAN